MSNPKVKYFSTGEFAKLCKVNKQTLIYYDQIGLLSPIFKDEKGYRFYTVAQYDFFTVITLLKEMGMSLKEIQAYMENKSPEGFLDLMLQQKKIVQEKRRTLEMIENRIDVKIQSMKEAIQLDLNAITVQNFPAKVLYLSENVESATEEEFVAAVSDFIDELNQSNLDTGHPIGAMIKKEQILTHNSDNYSYLYMAQPAPLQVHDYFTTRGGKYLVAYHIGDPYTVNQTYEKIFKYMEVHHYEIAGYAYEEYVYDAVIRDSSFEYVTRILVEVGYKKT